MKLILTGEVAGLGAPGDIVEVKDGYGRNYLVPQGLAMRATKGAEKQIASIKRARDVREVRDLAHAREIKTQLETLKVTLPTRAGAAGRLFGSVTVADVVAAVKAAGGPILDKRKVETRVTDQDRRHPPGRRARAGRHLGEGRARGHRCVVVSGAALSRGRSAISAGRASHSPGALRHASVRVSRSTSTSSSRSITSGNPS